MVIQRPKRTEQKENSCITKRSGKVDMVNELENDSEVVLLGIKSCLMEK